MIADLEAFEQSFIRPITRVTQLAAVAQLRVTDRKGQRTDEALAVQRGWRSLRPRLSQCLTLGPEIDDVELRLVVQPDGSVSGVRLRHGGTGAESADRCLVQTLSQAQVASPPATAQRLRADLSFPDETASR